MLQEPYQQKDRAQTLSNALYTLSAREQISLLLRSTGSLSNRDKAEILRVAGLSFLKDRFLLVLFHVLIKQVVTGALWWLLCIIATLFILFLLASIEQINPQAVTPVAVSVGSFFVGLLLFSLADFCGGIYQFFKRTRPRSASNELFARLNTLDYAEKVAILRSVSVALSQKVPGESFLAFILTNVLLLLAVALLIGLMIGVSSILPAIGNFPFILFVAVLTFLCGFFLPYRIKHRWLAPKAL